MKLEARAAVSILALVASLLLCDRAEFANAADTSPVVKVVYADGDTDFATVIAGVQYMTDRDYVFQNFPNELNGLTFTRRVQGLKSRVTIDAPAGTTVYVLLDNSGYADVQRLIIDSGWNHIGDTVTVNPDSGSLGVFKRVFSKATRVTIPGAGFHGLIVMAKKLELGDDEATTDKKPKTPAPPPAPAPAPNKTTNEFHADAAPDTRPSAGPTTPVAIPQTSIRSLEVYTQDSGLLLGQTSEVMLTVSRSDTSTITTVQFVTPIGQEMRTTRDEALRFIHLTYPNWYADTAQISFEDKYVAHDGGSIGAAVGTMVLSVIQGFRIDPNAAITGDISANGKVRVIGGVYAKLHGAVESKCSVVALPNENYDQVVDATIYSGLDLVTDVQVIGISTLNDAVATVRADRSPNLAQAITLFATIQADLKNKPTDLITKDIQQKLSKVLELAPNHLSAKILLAKAQGKFPKTMSPRASKYFTFVAVNPMVDLLAARRDDTSDQTNKVPSSTLQAGLKTLQKIHPIADLKIRPMVDAWASFIQAWASYQQGTGTLEMAQRRRQIALDEEAKVNADGELRQQMLKEGI